MAWNGTKTFVQGRWGFRDANDYITDNLESCFNFHQCDYHFSANGFTSIKDKTGTVPNIGTVATVFNYPTLQRSAATGPPPEPYRLFFTLFASWSTGLGANTLTIQIEDMLTNLLMQRSVTLPGRGNFSMTTSMLCGQNIVPGFVVTMVVASGTCAIWHGGTTHVAPLV